MKSKAIKTIIALALVTLMSLALSGCGAPAVLTDEQEEMFEQHGVHYSEMPDYLVLQQEEQWSFDGAKFMPYKELYIEDDETAAKVGFYYLCTYADNTERGGAAEDGELNSNMGYYLTYIKNKDAYSFRPRGSFCDEIVFDRQTAKPLYYITETDEVGEGASWHTVYVIE